jgi:hypothetical protein
MSSQEQKINNLLDRLRQESNPPRTSQMSGQQNIARNNGDVPQSRPSLQLDITTATMSRPRDLSFTTRSNENLETDRKLKEIMKISGNLTINNQIYET